MDDPIMGVHDFGSRYLYQFPNPPQQLRVGKGRSEEPFRRIQERQATHRSRDSKYPDVVFYLRLREPLMPDGPDGDIVSARCQPHAEIVNEAFFTADKWWVTLCEHENPHS